MPGGPSGEYIAARSAVLDALEALGPHRDAVILVGAQAIYIHTGGGDLTVAETTTDGDLVLDPSLIDLDPEIAAAMQSKGFYRDHRDGCIEVGIWSSLRTVEGVPAIVKVDLLMPQAVGGGGRRAARLEGHERGAVLKVRGLEGCLVDRAPQRIEALDGVDPRSFTIMVAGPAALLVGKLIKLAERFDEYTKGSRDRRNDKDALDVLRILRIPDMESLAANLCRLESEEISSQVTREAFSVLVRLFGAVDSPGSQMAGDAAFPEPPEPIAVACTYLTAELMARVERLRLEN